MLAATILFIATNAGVIGASRITYSMSSYRQLPEVFRRLHPRFKTPWLALIVFAGVFSILFMLPGNVDFIGRMYAFGAMLSFTIAHVSLIQMRRKPPPVEEPYRIGPNLRVRGVDWPLFAILGGAATAVAFLVVVVQDAPTRYAGLGWLARRVRLSTRSTGAGSGSRCARRRARRSCSGRRSRSSTATSSCRSSPGPKGQEAIDLAARLAAERGATIVALRVIVVPLDLPIDADARRRRWSAPTGCSTTRGTWRELYGVRMIERLVRSRSAGPRDRRGGRAPPERDRRPRRPAGRAPPDLRPDGRLRPQARAVPRDGRGRQEGRVSGRLPRPLQRRCSRSTIVGLGVAMIARHARERRRPASGSILGALFIAAGAGRLYAA